MKVLIDENFGNYVKRYSDVLVYVSVIEEEVFYRDLPYILAPGDALVIDGESVYLIRSWQFEREYLVSPKADIPARLRQALDKLAVIEPETAKIKDATDKIAWIETWVSTREAYIQNALDRLQIAETKIAQLLARIP